jgi:hypothetical protein
VYKRQILVLTGRIGGSLLKRAGRGQLHGRGSKTK